MRRFVVIGQTALASGDFLLDDVAGTSGRLDVLLRCIRASLLSSHGLRRDVVVYLVLLGGPLAPRTVRIDGATAKFIRPDERMLSVMFQKVLSERPQPGRVHPDTGEGFVDVRSGIAIASGGLEAVLADLERAALYVLDEGGSDIRSEPALGGPDEAFFLGDHSGFGEKTRERLVALGARWISVGPVSLHADDSITIVNNELDRRSG